MLSAKMHAILIVIAILIVVIVTIHSSPIPVANLVVSWEHGLDCL